MNYFYDLALKIASGHQLRQEELDKILDTPYTDVYKLLPGADMLRTRHSGKQISLCTITNAKSGRCSEDCAFCSQSGHHYGGALEYPLKKWGELADIGKSAAGSAVKRFSMVASGRTLSTPEVQEVARAIRELAENNISTCASLGMLGPAEFDILKNAGLERYHHNLETAPGFFQDICSTHSISERMQTIIAAKQTGLSVCSGGVFGLGETDTQVAELAQMLKELDVDAVPINFLIPIPGTPLENAPRITPLRCLKIISMMRYILPDKEIIICGGRIENLRELHSFVFMAGASSIMTGNYLTRKGRTLEEDTGLVRDLGLEIR